MIEKHNFYSDLPAGVLPEEIFQTICSGQSFQLKRIVSTGQTSPQEGWYEQQYHEWLILLKGGAKILFEQDNQEVILMPGDTLNIPAACRHRVSWTDSSATVWLAVYYEGGGSN